MTEAIVAGMHAKAAELGFTQQGDAETARFVGALVRLLRPDRALELGTGLGLTTHHILSNLSADAQFDSVERDATLVGAAREALPRDARLRIHHIDGEAFIGAAHPQTYDFVFADTWPGKYWMLAETLALVKPNGLYVVDDMLPRAGWTSDHAAKAEALSRTLQEATGWRFTSLPYGTGLALGCRM